MARIRGDNHAFGWPGLEPRWTHGDKDGIGTAYSAASRIWFTIWNGIVTEVYYPTVDTPQMRDVQLLFTDGQSFFHQETRYLETHIQRMPSCLGYRVEGKDPEGRYAYAKDIIADPHLPCLLQRVTVQANPEWLSRLKTYVLCAPHLDVGGAFDINNINKLEGRFWLRDLPFPNARHLRHPFQWKSPLPWHLGPAAKVRILRFKNLPPFRHDLGLQNHV